MASHSSYIECPCCEENADISIETRPFNREYIYCYNCGLVIYPSFSFMKLDEINEYRKDMGMSKLKKLKKRKYKLPF